MKNSILPIIAFLAAISAFVLLPVSAVAATIAVSVTGILALLAGDYARSVEPVRAPAPVVPFDLSRPALTEYRVAA